MTPELRQKLAAKLELKKRRKDKSDPVTDADTRRWVRPEKKPSPPTPRPLAGEGSRKEKRGWEHWTVPFDTDPDWPESLRLALTDYRAAWRAKMDVVNATIAVRADQEELVDQPRIERGKLRVCGPFTVEGVRPGEESLDLDGPVDALDDELETFGMEGVEDLTGVPPAVANAEAYLDRMLRLMRTDGVRFPGNNVVQFDTLQALQGREPLYAEGEWTTTDGERRQVAVAFGPEFGPITSEMVYQCIRKASRRGYDELVFARFSFDGA